MTKTTKHIFLILSVVLLNMVAPSNAQQRVVSDDKLLHFGFSLGVDFLSYNVEEKDDQTQMDHFGSGVVYHARTMSPGVGFSVGFISDLRLTKHLSLRFCPGMHFGERTITYRMSYNDEYMPDSLISGMWCKNNKPSVLSLPIDLPFYVKWAADREANYRPYITVGGGVSFDLGRSKDRVILQKTMDYFLEIGLGCDLYFPWFKLGPEIRYRIGFNNILTPTSDVEKLEWGLPEDDYFYTDALSRLTNQQISLIFNFE